MRSRKRASGALLAVLVALSASSVATVDGNSSNDGGPSPTSGSDYWRERGLAAGVGILPDPDDPRYDAWSLEQVAREAIKGGEIKLDYRAILYAAELIDITKATSLLQQVRFGELPYGVLERDWWEGQGVDRNAAVTRLQLETLAGILSTAFNQYDTSFTSLTIDPSGRFVRVLRTDESDSMLVDALRRSELADFVRFETAAEAQRDLQAEIIRVVDLLESRSIERDFGMWIAPESGRLIVELEGAMSVGPTDARRIIDLFDPRFRDLVDLRSTGGQTIPASTLIGGLSISNNGGCEMAFSVSGVIGPGSTTATGLVTAAHCGDNGQYPAGNSLPFIREYGDDVARDETDAQFHTKGAGNTVDNRVRYTSEGSPPGTLYVDITSRTGWGGQTPPQTVCHNGSSTGVRTCGVIETNTYTPSSAVSADPEWVRVVMRSCLGDSGASIWRGNSAYGILHAASGNVVGTCSNGQQRREKTVYGAITFAEGRLQMVVLTN